MFARRDPKPPLHTYVRLSHIPHRQPPTSQLAPRCIIKKLSIPLGQKGGSKYKADDKGDLYRSHAQAPRVSYLEEPGLRGVRQGQVFGTSPRKLREPPGSTGTVTDPPSSGNEMLRQERKRDI